MAGTGSSKNVDPIAYRAEEQQNVDSPVTESTQNWQFDPAKLKNADVNLSAYGDDSSETNYNNPNLWGGENDKYKGAETRNTSIAYDKNATLENLNPNYAYGQKAQMVNSSDAGYIQRRNDQIASALYNAGKVSEQDVADFLNQQAGFQNSTENERANTIKSVWKRLGEISSNGNQNENKTDTTNKAENDSAVKNMESDLLQSTAGELYGKNTADWRGEDRAIKTLEDQYSVERAVNEQRIANFKNLQAMSSEQIAVMLSEGNSLYGEQSMRDLMQYDPNKYNEIQNELKAIKSQDMINQISENGKMDVLNQMETEVDSVNSETNQFVEQNSSERTKEQLQTSLSNALSESEIVNTARGQVEVYKRKVEEIQEAIDELPSLARSYFKSDVPQYLVNAFISNRMQKYNKELQKYQNLQSATLDEVKFEIDQINKEKDREIKRASLQADQNYKNANLALQYRKYESDQANKNLDMVITMMKAGKWDEMGNFRYVNPYTGNIETLSADTAEVQINAIVGQNADAFFSTRQEKLDEASANGVKCYGKQCESFTDNYTNQFYGITMEGEGHSRTTAEEKASYANTGIPSKGLVAIWNFKNGTENMKKYGHTGIVMDVNRDTGTFTYMASNNKGDEAVGIYTGNINDGNLVGFWNPTKPKGMQQDEGGYAYYNTPMRSIFQQAYNTAKTKDLKDAIAIAEDSYAIMNELQEGGYIDSLINAKGVDTLFSQISNGKFVDSDGNIDFAKISDYARNKIRDKKVTYAIDRLHRLIEKKLRKESGAAISQSEWNANFDMYLPQIGQSKELKRQHLIALERDIVAGALPTTYRDKYVQIIPDTGSKKKSLFTGMAD